MARVSHIVTLHCVREIWRCTIVAIVRIRVYASDIVMGTGIIYCEAGRDSGPGSPSNLVLLSWETAAGRVVASCGGRGELVSWSCNLRESRRVFSMR